MTRLPLSLLNMFVPALVNLYTRDIEAGLHGAEAVPGGPAVEHAPAR